MKPIFLAYFRLFVLPLALNFAFISSSKAQSAFITTRLANGYLDICSFSNCGFTTADHQTVKLTTRGWTVSSRTNGFSSPNLIGDGLNLTTPDLVEIDLMTPLSGIVVPQPGRGIYYSDVSSDGRTVLGVSAGSPVDGNGFEQGSIFFIQDTVGSFADLTKQPFVPPVFSKNGAIVYVNDGKVTVRNSISSSPRVVAALLDVTAVDSLKLVSQLIQANSDGVVVGKLPGRIFVYDPQSDSVRTKVSIDGAWDREFLPNIGELLQVLPDVAVFERGILSLSDLTFQYHTDIAPRLYSENKSMTITNTDNSAFYSEDGINQYSLECLLPAKFKLTRVFKVNNDGSLIVSGYQDKENFGIYELRRSVSLLSDSQNYCQASVSATINRECRKYFSRYDDIETNYHSAVPPFITRAYEVKKTVNSRVSGCYLEFTVSLSGKPLKGVRAEVNDFFYSRYGTLETKVRGFDSLKTNAKGKLRIPLKAAFLRPKHTVTTAFRPSSQIYRFGYYPIAIRRKQ